MSNRIQRLIVLLGAALLVGGVLTGSPAQAAQGDCSQPVTNGNNPTASDCLFILRAAVGSETCTPSCICDPSGAGGTTASDALVCLKKAVGQSVTLDCPCVTTTSTSSTTVTTSSTTTSSTIPVTTTFDGTTTTVPGGTTTTVPGGTTTTVPGGTTTTVPGGTTTTVPGGTTTTIGGGTTTTIGGGTTTTIPGGTTTTVPGGTTTTVEATTTTVAVTTTTIGGTSECPSTADLTIVAGTRGACTTNGDCGVVGTCNTDIGRCQTQTDLDTGYTGISHNADLTDNVFVRANLDCPGEGPTCGVCNIAGIDPSPGYCRCANDNQAICDEPFAADNDDCGGDTCNCYLGPPLALSAGNTPACVVNRLFEDISGTTNVDTGSSQSTVNLRSVVFTGGDSGTYFPCPYCTGDATVGDGERDGTCVNGPNNGDPCDADGFNRSFPAPGGDGHSLDCFPDLGTNVSGGGLIIDLEQSTGSHSLTAAVPCGFPPTFDQLTCHCGICTGDATVPCSSDGDCATAGGPCKHVGSLVPRPDSCSNACVDTGNGLDGECDESGPDNRGCDGVLRANDEPFFQCISNSDCAEENIGIDAGLCTLITRQACFLPTILAQGTADPETPVGADIFCIAQTSNGGINGVAGLPGPARVFNQGIVEHQCTNGAYVPGVGCP